MPDLSSHLAYLEGALRDAIAAPLSLRKARLAAALADTFPDRLFAVQRTGDDILQFRASLGRSSPALAAIFDLCSGRDGVRLAVESVEVPAADYPELLVEDFMISVYNGQRVQRIVFAHADGRREDAHSVLAEAVRALAAAAGNDRR